MTIFTAKLKHFLENHPNVNGFAISTPTEDEAQMLVQALFELGFFWDNENPEETKYTSEGKLNTKWEKNSTKTCYTVSLIPNKQIFFCNTKFYEKRGREIYSMEDINNIELPDYELRFLSEKDKTVNTKDNNNKDEENGEIDRDVEEKQEPKYLCPYCGYEIKKDVKFCPDCGQRINEPVLADELVELNEDLSTNKSFTENLNNSENMISEPAVPVEAEQADKTELSNDKTDDKVSFVNIEDNDSNKTTPVEKKPTEENASSTTDNSAFKASADEDRPLILKMLGLEVNEEFHIIPDNYFNSKNIYRFNREGYREVKAGDNIWFIANDEQDLAYIINHPDEIQVVSKK